MTEEDCTTDNNKEIKCANGLVYRSNTHTQSNGTKVHKSHQKVTLYYGGPRGALLFIILAPIFVLMLNFMCTKDSCTISKIPKISTDLFEYFDLSTLYNYLCGVGIVLVLHNLPLGSVVNGQPSPSGRVLQYRLNGGWIILVFIMIIALFVGLELPLHLVHQRSTSYITIATLISFTFSTYLYLRSFTVPRSDLSNYGNTGNGIYDFFMGRELNPRIGNLDIKQFCLRFGMLSWAAYDASLIASQSHIFGNAHRSLLLVVLGHTAAIMDFLGFEENLLTSFTINYQGTGFLLVFGSLVFVPFVFSLNARFMVELGYKLESEPMLIILFFLIAGAHAFYRFTNSDKSMFLRYPDHPEVANYEYIEAEDGKRILVDGWWATVRHPNYLADILTGFAWCTISGFTDVISYTYVIFQILFTLHQVKQNEEMCCNEFGKAWDIYCQKVKYKLIKYVF